ncbi:MAG: YdeI/OmpD-associated family protein [Bacteroidetes bacterium]|nr:YdeI/OmpD-associated family protein [Bacteroidota bacterium]
MNPKVDAFIAREKQWKKEFELLREIALECELGEELKWGQPCYTTDGKNVLIIHGFKEYCGMLFVKGALLKDPKSILIQQTENVQAARQARFTSVQEITKLRTTLKAYIREAVDVEKKGLKVALKKTSEYTLPEEFEAKLRSNPKLRSAFNSLTPGRQRGYILYFSSAKQSKTREARIEKFTPNILAGKGLDD